MAKFIRPFNVCELTVTSWQAGFDLSKLIGGKIDHLDVLGGGLQVLIIWLLLIIRVDVCIQYLSTFALQ